MNFKDCAAEYYAAFSLLLIALFCTFFPETVLVASFLNAVVTVLGLTALVVFGCAVWLAHGTVYSESFRESLCDQLNNHEKPDIKEAILDMFGWITPVTPLSPQGVAVAAILLLTLHLFSVGWFISAAILAPLIACIIYLPFPVKELLDKNLLD